MVKPAVNSPVNPELRDKDIVQKLQLYGIYSALGNGKLPSNKQIDGALNSLLLSQPLSNPSPRLSAQSRRIVGDVREVIADAKSLILVKNEGNLIQEFFWDVSNADHSGIQRPGGIMERDAAKDHGQQTAEGLKTLGTLIVTNGQFRKLLRDSTLLVRDMFSDSAQKAAGLMRPSQEEMSQIDKPAEDNVWHAKPDISKGAIKSKTRGRRESPRRDSGIAGGGHSIDEQDTSGDVGTSSNIGPSGDAGTSSDVAGEVAEKSNQRGREFADRTKNFLAQKMPQERREQTVWRIKKMIVEIQGHSDYQQAIETLLSLAEKYADQSRSAANQGAGNMKGAQKDSDLQTLESNLRTIMERFANSTSFDDLFNSIKKFYRNADKDPQLRTWFKSVNQYIRRCLQQQGYVLQDEATEEWNKLYDEGRYLLTNRYREDTNRVVGEIKFLGDQFDQDPLNKAFGQSVKRLFDHLGHDDNGKIAFKTQLVKDFMNIVLPGIAEHIRYVPIPRIEVQDPMIDMVIENLAVDSDNIFPNVVELSSDNYWRWGRRQISNKHENQVMVSALGIQTDWRDVSYYIRKKAGFPKIKDTGVMDIFMGDEGFSFKIMGSTVQKGDKEHFIKPEKVSVSIKNLKIKVKKSKHKMLFGFFKPLIFSVVQPALEKVLEEQIKNSFMKVDAFAHNVHTEATRTRDMARNDANDKRSFYEHYLGAVRTKMTEKKQETEVKAQEAAKRDTKINVAVTQYDSLFKDIRLPGGISSKATEFKDLASKGERWESPVFTFDNASESTDLPTVAPISRKPHNILVKEGDQGQQVIEPVAIRPDQTQTMGSGAAEPKARGAIQTKNIPNTIPGTQCPV